MQKDNDSCCQRWQCRRDSCLDNFERPSVSSRTKARVAWKVVFYCSNRASTCSHALIFLSQTRWIVMTGWRTSISRQPVFKHIWIVGSLLYTSISFRPVFQTHQNGGSLSAHTHQYPALCSDTFGLRFCVCVQTSVDSLLTKHVWIVVLVVYKRRLHLVFQTRSECGSLSAYTHQFLAPYFIHVWVIDSVSGYKHLPLPPWSNTFGFWSPRTHQFSTLCF